jgi:nitrogen-specific signal transduction histidine kinase
LIKGQGASSSELASHFWGIRIPVLAILDVFRLFETAKSHGSGVGVAVAVQIVIAHGGMITHGLLAARGTVFHVELPLAG